MKVDYFLFGRILHLLSAEQYYSRFGLFHITNLILEPLNIGQVVIIRKHGLVAGFLTYALLDSSVERKIVSENYSLARDDWRSGNFLWIIDACLRNVSITEVKLHLTKVFHSHSSVKYVRRNQNGSVKKVTELIRQGETDAFLPRRIDVSKFVR